MVEWYENGVLVATVDYTGGTPVYIFPAGLSKAPTFFPAGPLGPYAIAIKVGDGPSIGSKVKCGNGQIVTGGVTTGTTLVSRKYTWEYLVGGTWITSSYFSYTYPPYLDEYAGVPAAFAHSSGSGGYFVAAQGPDLIAVRIIEAIDYS